MTTNSFTQDVSKSSAWSVFMGVLTAAIGIIMILYPFATSTITTLFVGWSFIFVGVAQFVFAFTSTTAGNFFLKILLGIVYLATGVALAFFPIAGTAALTITLGALLLFQSILEAVTAFEVKPLTGWGWFLFDAICSLALGVMILASWPTSSLWAIGTLVGVGVLVNGITRIVVSATIHHDVSKFAKGTV
ncbi:MAG TPA: HdeD family acid-resistance protein [Thermoanaerobaculia bacterium]|nr:HdeD family acid-resistance protein [Thermoanaerobaculia bacterium]